MQPRLAFTASIIAFSVGTCAVAANWPTFAGSARRLGNNAYETILTPNTVPDLQLKWTANLGGATMTQPLYIKAVLTRDGKHDEVFQTTNSSHVLALNAATGDIDWKVKLPTSQAQSNPCVPVGDGIRGTPTIDPAAQLLYVVDGNGALHALALGTGAEANGYPVQIINSTDLATGGFNHSSPTLIGVELYITTSGRPSCEGARSPFHGSVVQFNTRSRLVKNTFYPVQAATGGGGIWGSGGVMEDPINDRRFVATGNALAEPDDAPLAESIVALSKTLKVLESDSPGPKYLNPDGDLDFGSTPTPIDVKGCPPLLSALNKNGDIFLFDRADLKVGPLQVMNLSYGGGRGTLIGMAAYDPATQMLFVNNPLASENGLVTNGGIALQVTRPSCTASIVWQTTYGTNQFSANTRSTDPVIAGGVVYFVTGASDSVLALDEMTGAPLWSSGSILPDPTTTPVLVEDGQMFVQSGSQIFAFGLPNE